MNSSFWTSDHTYALRSIDCIPTAERHRLIEIFDMADRCFEELQYCIADILNMLEYFNKLLFKINIEMCGIVRENCQTDPSNWTNHLTPEDVELYIVVGRNISSGVLKGTYIEALSAYISKAEYTYYRMQRICDVAANLVEAYWAECELEQKHHTKMHLIVAINQYSFPVT